MNIFKKISIFIISIILVSGLSAQPVTWSSLDSNTIMIGDQVKYELGITFPNDMIVAWPYLLDTITSNIEIIRRSNIDTTYSNNNITLQQQFLITSFDSGYFKIPPTDFMFQHIGDTNFSTVSTNMLFLQVNVPVVDTAQEFKPLAGPINEPYTFQELLPWFMVITAAIIVIALLLYYFIKRKKKQPVFKRKPKPVLPADILAINKLEELRLAKIWQAGHLKKYYSELTDIVREYMVNRYHFDAPEMTSYEIISKLDEFDINNDAMTKLGGVLNLSDMVKFAKANPTALENDLCLSHSLDFVNETKKTEVPEQTDDNNETNSKLSQ